MDIYPTVGPASVSTSDSEELFPEILLDNPSGARPSQLGDYEDATDSTDDESITDGNTSVAALNAATAAASAATDFAAAANANVAAATRVAAAANAAAAAATAAVAAATRAVTADDAFGARTDGRRDKKHRRHKKQRARQPAANEAKPPTVAEAADNDTEMETSRPSAPKMASSDTPGPPALTEGDRAFFAEAMRDLHPNRPHSRSDTWYLHDPREEPAVRYI